VADAASALHELDLLFVYADYASVGIRMTVESDDKTVGE